MLTATIAGCGPSDMDDDRPTHVHSCCACELMAAGESALGTRGRCGETEDSIFPARSVRRGTAVPRAAPFHHDRGRESLLLPLPPNRTGGSPAYGSPVGGFTWLRIDQLPHQSKEIG